MTLLLLTRGYPKKKRSLIPIMERNILLNRLQSNVTAAELDWYVWPLY